MRDGGKGGFDWDKKVAGASIDLLNNYRVLDPKDNNLFKKYD